MVKEIIVTGASGFLGRHLLPVLEKRYGASNVQGLTSADYELTNPAHVDLLFRDHTPRVVVHLAAYSGGIGANVRYPADFYHRNIVLQALMFRAAARHGVRKLIYPIGGCSYPAQARSPIDEAQMWDGYPQPESAGYSAAKKMGIVASVAYRQQYGLNSVVLIPGNMYGEYDNFREHESHVVPAMVRRCFEANRRGDPELVMWGTGRPERDFVYAGDVAALVPFFIDQYDCSEPVNISSGTTTTIRDLAELVGELTGFPGRIRWDTTRPDGQMVKVFSVRRLKELGLTCPTPLREGLGRTVRWLARNYDDRGDGLRL